MWPVLGEDAEAAGRDHALEEEAGLQAVVVLVADDDQGRQGERPQLGFQSPEGRTPRLDPAHGQRRAAVRVGGEALRELAPAARVLVLELHAARTIRVYRHEGPRAVRLEAPRDLKRDARKYASCSFSQP